MIRLLVLPLIAVLVSLSGPLEGWAQSKFPVQITDVRVGLPGGPFRPEVDDNDRPRPLFKTGHWTPIFVDLEFLRKPQEPLELVVETVDGDDHTSQYAVPLPAVRGDQRTLSAGQLPYLPYLKPGRSPTDITVRVVGKSGDLAEAWRRTYYGASTSSYFLMTLGPPLPKTFEMNPGDGPNQGRRNLSEGKLEIGSLTRLEDLPDHWFGYASVDLLLLTTGNDDSPLLRQLFGANQRDTVIYRKQQALLEWVRRGGKMLISLGRNVPSWHNFAAFQELLPARLSVEQWREENSLRLVWSMGKAFSPPREMKATEGGKIIVSVPLRKGDRPWRVLMPSYKGADPDPSRPVIVQGSYGMGQVTLVCFDLDRPPFIQWADRGVFWEWLIGSSGGRLPSAASPTSRASSWNNRGGTAADGPATLSTQLHNHIDNFHGVAVVSFGWVALFIFVYILLIGPGDYFLLKKVFKRMEWTWITFPLIVFVVSALAYFTAYSLKGKELRVNKVDVVDIDLGSQRIYGTTWFTLFSPQIQNYFPSLEPIAPGWSSTDAISAQSDIAMSWHGMTTAGRSSLFRRTYRYHNAPANHQFASSIEQVSVQVWSTKSFQAKWSSRINAKAPLLTTTLRHPPADPTGLIGEVTSHLPLERLHDVRLFYRGRVYTPYATTLVRGETTGFRWEQSQAVFDWLKAESPDYLIGTSTTGSAGTGRKGSQEPVVHRMWSALFFEALETTPYLIRNSSLRELDQSWRLHEDAFDEAILIGRVPPSEGEMEALMSDSSGTPTRLWLFETPASGRTRTPLPGRLRQETYVRVFIPISPAP